MRPIDRFFGFFGVPSAVLKNEAFRRAEEARKVNLRKQYEAEELINTVKELEATLRQHG